MEEPLVIPSYILIIIVYSIYSLGLFIGKKRRNKELNSIYEQYVHRGKEDQGVDVVINKIKND